MSKHVGLTTSCSTEDPVIEYSFFVYEVDPEIEAINAQEEAWDRVHRRKKHTLSPQMMDQMSNEEIDEWYEHNGRSYDNY